MLPYPQLVPLLSMKHLTNSVVVRALAAVGEISFSVYLLHPLLIIPLAVFEEWHVSGTRSRYLLIPEVLGVLGCVLSVSWCWHHALERPIVSLIRRGCQQGPVLASRAKQA